MSTICGEERRKHHEGNDNVHNGNEHEQQPPSGLTANFKHDVRVVNRDEDFPPSFPGLCEHTPHAEEVEHTDKKTDKTHDRRSGTHIVIVVVII